MKMIKRYNQFVKGKINEDMVPPVNVDPISSEKEDVEIEKLEGELPRAEATVEEEEEGGDLYQKTISELESKLNANGIKAEKINNEVIVKKKDNTEVKVTFPSENNMFHIDGKKRANKSIDQIVDEIKNMMGSYTTDHETPEISDKEAIEDLQMAAESKSYKTTRRFRSSKK